MSAITAEDVLKRWAKDEESDDEEIALQDKKTVLPMTQAQKYEFRMAYRVVAGENCFSIPAEKVYDVYQAMGYTFLQEDIDRYYFGFWCF